MLQALWLLHTIALKFSSCPESKVILEGALQCLTSIITDHYPVDEESSVDELCIGGRTLAVACQLNPELSCDKVIVRSMFLNFFFKAICSIPSLVLLTIFRILAVKVGSSCSYEAYST